MAPREVLRDAINVGGMRDDRRAESATAFRAFARQQMAFAGAHPHHFAGAGNLNRLATDSWF